MQTTHGFKRRAILVALSSIVIVMPSVVIAGTKAAPAFSTEAEKCIVPASVYHGVNFYVLRSILRVESSLNPQAVNKNGNGSVDVGLGQTNSIHFKELAKYGISPDDLHNACVSTYVAAWQLKKHISANGNTWASIARYHSATPYFNSRYQILLRNELIRSGFMQGKIEAVPRLASSGGVSATRSTGPKSSQKKDVEPSMGLLVFDTTK